MIGGPSIYLERILEEPFVQGTANLRGFRGFEKSLIIMGTGHWYREPPCKTTRGKRRRGSKSRLDVFEVWSGNPMGAKVS